MVFGKVICKEGKKPLELKIWLFSSVSVFLTDFPLDFSCFFSFLAKKGSTLPYYPCFLVIIPVIKVYLYAAYETAVGVLPYACLPVRSFGVIVILFIVNRYPQRDVVG